MEDLKRNKKYMECGVCKVRKWDVQRIQAGGSVLACPDCRNELKNTTLCLRVSCDWMMEKFDTHQRTSKSFVLRPYNAEGYGLKVISKRNRSKSISINELQKTPTSTPWVDRGQGDEKSLSPTVTINNAENGIVESTL